MNSYHYSSPPPSYGFDPTSPYSPSSPYGTSYVYYLPQRHYDTTPIDRTTRVRIIPTTKTKIRPAGWSAPATGEFHRSAADYASPHVEETYVSCSDRPKIKVRRFSSSGPKIKIRTTRTQKPSVFVDAVDDAGPTRRYVSYDAKPKPKKAKRNTDEYYYLHQDILHDDQPRRSRARRASTARTSHKPTASRYEKGGTRATEEDAARAGIPIGYSYKNWDPTELPIILLGSVFDANSLGKWIYDWTVFHHNASSPLADVAGELWLLLIKLAGKMKRGEECVDRIRNLDSLEMMEDFLASGDRLWQKIKDLLKACERYMWRGAKRDGRNGISMGLHSGTEFVDSIFGRDRELETTEKIMTSIRLWSMRFDANCEEILKRPGAA